MQKLISEKIKALASSLSYPLYLVGGSPRNYLISGQLGTDYDLASATTAEELEEKAIYRWRTYPLRRGTHFRY